MAAFSNPYRQPSMWRRAAVLAAVVALVGVAFASGLWLGAGERGAQAAAVASYLRIGDRGAPQRISETVDFKQFWQVWDYVKQQGLNGSKVKDLDLFYGAQAGIVAALDDPYSIFFPPDDAAEFATELSGRFSGIGAEIGARDGKLVIIAPLPGTPAEKAGLKPGDVLLAIDGQDTYGMPVDVAITKIRGERGTTVTLVLERDGKQVEVPIQRDTIVVPDVKVTYEGSVAVIRLYHFNEHSAEEFNDALVAVAARRPTGVILDLRGNPGGYLDQAVSIAGAWLNEGDLVAVERRSDGGTSTYAAESSGPLRSTRTVVLVDGGSASASEIVAGALQDYGMAKLVGQKTFGKGSVQSLLQLEDGSAIKLTTAAWLTPKGRAINDVGIEPDVAVEDAEGDEDEQLQAALRELRR